MEPDETQTDHGYTGGVDTGEPDVATGWAAHGRLRTRPDVLPPSPIVVTQDDFIGVRSVNSVGNVQLTLRARFMDLDGVVRASQWDFVPPPTSLPSTFTARLGDGYLLSVTLLVSGGALKQGQCFSQVVLLRGVAANLEVYEHLTAGYAINGYAFGWPEDTPYENTYGAGFLKTDPSGAPAAGAQINRGVPVSRRWSVIGGRFQLTTNATVANRFVHVQFLDAASVPYYEVAGPAQAASLTFTYVLGNGIGPTLFQDNLVLLPIPSNMEMLASFSWQTVTTGMQAGDQFSSGILGVKEWIEE